MKLLLDRSIFDIIRLELPSGRRRSAMRVIDKIASVAIIRDRLTDAAYVRLIPYLNVELTTFEEDTVFEIEDILTRNIERLAAEMEKGAGI